MADVRVTCINKPDRFSRHEHITHLGNCPQWKWTREQVIASIDAGTNTFFVLDSASGKRANIAVRREPGKAPYVQTHADGVWNDNLLALPECTC